MNEVSIAYLFQIVLKRIWIVILSLVVCASVAFAYCSFIAVPVYKIYASLIVTNGAVISTTESGETIKSSDISASLNLIDSCVDILKTPGIYAQLSENLNSNPAIKEKVSADTLAKNFNITKRDDYTLFIDVSYKTSIYDDIAPTIQEFMRLSPDYICEVLPSTQIRIMSERSIISKISPRKAYTTVFAGLIGAVVAMVVIIIVSLSDQTIKSEEDFASSFSIPVLGIVPDFEDSHQEDYGYGK